jgi:hypothetical protein
MTRTFAVSRKSDITHTIEKLDATTGGPTTFRQTLAGDWPVDPKARGKIDSTQGIPFDRKPVRVIGWHLGQARVPMLGLRLKPVIQILPFWTPTLFENFLGAAFDGFAGGIAVERYEFAHGMGWLGAHQKKGSALELASADASAHRSCGRKLGLKEHLTHRVEQRSNGERFGQYRVAL